MPRFFGACLRIGREEECPDESGHSRPQACATDGDRPGLPPHRQRGFTFVELMVVITIIVILISMAIPIYSKTLVRSKESVLANNLFTLRTCIDNYTYDKQKAPQSLQDLVSERYLIKLPVDPITGSSQTWHTVQEDPSQAVDQSQPGIFDVRSGSDKMGLNSKAYAEW